mgnify:CR=1 FL=1
MQCLKPYTALPPRMVEEGLSQYANPESILRAAVMLLRHICRGDAAVKLESALNSCTVLVDGTPAGATCEEYGSSIIAAL